ncbi:hypothetical protein A2348_04675 [Candidatus Uhrbacteria bacterium RIFOXYB12_FULL_58_10]|nr:MAG: hypothetical protein A2348_04675 [Candidatus Uhrbacteria bacterium RIFOXYB12_FULL_58_10]
MPIPTMLPVKRSMKGRAVASQAIMPAPQTIHHERWPLVGLSEMSRLAKERITVTSFSGLGVEERDDEEQTSSQEESYATHEDPKHVHDGVTDAERSDKPPHGAFVPPDVDRVEHEGQTGHEVDEAEEDRPHLALTTVHVRLRYLRMRAII